MNVHEKLRAEYEATLRDYEWEVNDGRDDDGDGEVGVAAYPEPERRWSYIDIFHVDSWIDDGNRSAENIQWAASAHETGYPLYMAVAEAAMKCIAPIGDEVIIFDYVADPPYECGICGGMGETLQGVAHEKDCALGRLRSALAPLLEGVKHE